MTQSVRLGDFYIWIGREELGPGKVIRIYGTEFNMEFKSESIYGDHRGPFDISEVRPLTKLEKNLRNL